ncbi:MAG: hypothetical protein ABI605_17905 [Rhizobacter sp.]
MSVERRLFWSDAQAPLWADIPHLPNARPGRLRWLMDRMRDEAVA